MGKARRRRSFSDSSESESGESESGSEDVSREKSPDQEDADNWVLCDRCTKWRRIPAGFADQIKEDTPWYCEHNPNKAFASCSVPQELTNEEIDADGSDASDLDEEEALKRRRMPAVWQLLKDNVLAHRKRKAQDEDDIMICHCKPVYRGGDGCGPDCINRMLCIECVPGFCPSEDKCTNQMFSKRMYANLEIRRAGAKGFGLYALEDIKAGQFVIEYIGEVLDEDEYQRRKDYYMSVGQRHYYFMNIGNGEVIDACRKGNISRFINHSCEPNCETQKWLVRGELAIGLFAVRDIPKDTELTFDYNFERYGDKPMRCHCQSTNCRQFIGGMQDNVDLSQLTLVEPESASKDLPPIMLTDADMDPNMRMLLEWRVGAKVDKAKEMGMVTRLERICKARNVEWTVKHFYGQEAGPAQLPATAVAPSTSGRGTEQEAAAGGGAASAGLGADAEAGGVPPKSKQQRKAEKAAAGSVEVGLPGKGKAAGSGAAKQQADGEAHTASVAKLRIEDSAHSTTPSAGPGPASTPREAAGSQAARQAAAPTPGATPDVAQVRGPKALFKQWKIMQQQDAAPAPATEEKLNATTSSLPSPSPQSPHSPPSPQAPPSPRSSGSLANDDAALEEVRTVATAAAKHVPLRKRLRRLVPKAAHAEPVAEPAPELTDEPQPEERDGGQLAAASAAPAEQPDDGGAASAAPAAAEPAVVVAALSRKTSAGSAGAVTASVGFPAAVARRSASPPPTANGRGLAGDRPPSRKLRSEIDRRLDEVVGSNGRLKDPSRQNIIKVLRLFNLCDIGSQPTRAAGFGAAAGGRYLNGGMSRNGDDVGMAGPGPGSIGGLTARQRARMADLSLLLDVVLKTTSSAAKKEFVACGLLTQLHQAMGRNTGKEYCVILRKVLRVVETLPLEANDVYAVRSAHGNFADMLRQLSTNTDYDVRTKAAALLKKFPPSAVTDQRLLQLMAAPPVRFGHSRGGGGAGMRMAGGFGGMLPLAMQQQILQQQQQLLQQQMLKQQQMLRLKESAASGAASNGLPPPPPLGPGGATSSVEGAGAEPHAGSLPRTSSTASLVEDHMDVDQAGQSGPTGLPPLGPGRQRALAVAAAAAAALASRPGLLRPMACRGGMMGGPGLLGPMTNALSMSAGSGNRAGAMGMMGMGPSPLGLPPRPPSPADAFSGYSGNGVVDDSLYSSSKRRKHSHPHGLDSPAHGDAAGGPLPGPPARPPYSLASGFLSHRRHSYGVGEGGGDGRDREVLPGPPSLSSDLPLPPPPPHPSHYAQHHYGLGRASEERDLPMDLPERLSVEQLFALQRPLARSLPPLQGTLQPERHVHGQLTDAVMLFALGLYGGYCRPSSKGAPHPVLPSDEPLDSSASDVTCWVPLSPLVSSAEPPWSPLQEAPPPPPAAQVQLAPAAPTASSERPLTPPPAGAAAPVDCVQTKPLRSASTLTLAGGAVPSPYHQQGSPAQCGAWEGAGPAATGLAAGSASSTPTVSALGATAQLGGFMPPSGANGAAAAASAAVGLPPVVPISSLSEWRLPAAGTGPNAAAVAAGNAASGGPLPAVARASPHTSPDHHCVAAAAAAGRDEGDNIDEWLRPVSSHHADVWEEPDASFEAYVTDMVRHRLGKYLQPEHPSRVTVQEATVLRNKVYREVVAKERRAWEERRAAGVYKPIERHKLEANLKEFVRSTIKRMRDREKEKAPGGAAGASHASRGAHASHHMHGHTPPQGPTPVHSAQAFVSPMDGTTPGGSARRQLSPPPAPAGLQRGASVAGVLEGRLSQGPQRDPEPAVDEGPGGDATARPVSGACGGTVGAGDVAMAEAAA